MAQLQICNLLHGRRQRETMMMMTTMTRILGLLTISVSSWLISCLSHTPALWVGSQEAALGVRFGITIPCGENWELPNLRDCTNCWLWCEQLFCIRALLGFTRYYRVTHRDSLCIFLGRKKKKKEEENLGDIWCNKYSPCAVRHRQCLEAALL